MSAAFCARHTCEAGLRWVSRACHWVWHRSALRAIAALRDTGNALKRLVPGHQRRLIGMRIGGEDCEGRRAASR